MDNSASEIINKELKDNDHKENEEIKVNLDLKINENINKSDDD
jgi:hypothetical protein